MKRKRVNILIIIGLLFITAALSLTGYNVLSDMKASVRAADCLQRLEFGAEAFDWEQTPEMEMPAAEAGGVPFVGALEVPDLGLRLPVASYWSEEFAKTAPCRYTGSPYTGDLIVAGHNYRRHFGMLSRLQPGSEVYFTDIAGNTFFYTVYSIEAVDGSDIERMKAGSEGWDLTLFTCNFSGRARLAVRCVEQ